MLRLFLRAYPKRFRERHGEDLLRLCREVYGVGFSPRAAADLFWNGMKERLGDRLRPGAYKLAMAGILDGKKAATHHDAWDDFEKRFPKISLERGVRYVQGDPVVFTAGGPHLRHRSRLARGRAVLRTRGRSPDGGVHGVRRQRLDAQRRVNQRCDNKRRTASRWGSEACAPSTVVASAAAALANGPASSRERPSARQTASALANASPAPVASTRLTSNRGSHTSRSREMRTSPCSPACTAAIFAPRRSRSSAASRALPRSRTGMPVRISASDVFGRIRSSCATSESGSRAGGPGSRMTTHLALRPRRTASSTASRGTPS